MLASTNILLKVAWYRGRVADSHQTMEHPFDSNTTALSAALESDLKSSSSGDASALSTALDAARTKAAEAGATEEVASFLL